jgi:hypothetical protein
MDLRTHVDMMSSHMAILRASPDFAEGVAALRERRPPRFGVSSSAAADAAEDRA